jgi:hypothetical protein
MTIYALPDGSTTTVDPSAAEEIPAPTVAAIDRADEQHELLDSGAFYRGRPLDPRGSPVDVEAPASLTAATVALAERRAAEQRAAEAALAEEEAERLRAHRANFDAAVLEAADLLSVDPREIVARRVTDDFAEIVTTEAVWRHDGTFWTNVGRPATSTVVGPHGLVLSAVTLDELTDDERVELDRWFPPHRPAERAEIFRSPEGLVVGDGQPGSKARTLLPGDSGRAGAVGLMWEQDLPAEARRADSGFHYNVWAGPGTGLDEAKPAAATPPSVRSGRPLDAAERTIVEGFASVAQAVLDAAGPAAQLQKAVAEIYIAWESALGRGATVRLIGQPVFDGLRPLLDEMLREDEGGLLSPWRVELGAATAQLAPPADTGTDTPRPRRKWRG